MLDKVAFTIPEDKHSVIKDKIFITGLLCHASLNKYLFMLRLKDPIDRYTTSRLYDKNKTLRTFSFRDGSGCKIVVTLSSEFGFIVLREARN